MSKTVAFFLIFALAALGFAASAAAQQPIPNSAANTGAAAAAGTLQLSQTNVFYYYGITSGRNLSRATSNNEADTATLTYTLTGPGYDAATDATDLKLPAGVTFRAVSPRMIYGDTTAFGRTRLTYTATNAAGVSVTAHFNLTIERSWFDPIDQREEFAFPQPTHTNYVRGFPIIPLTMPRRTGGGNITVRFTGFDPSNRFSRTQEPLHVAIPGLTFDSSTLVVSGTPTRTGAYTATYQVTTEGAQRTNNISITVHANAGTLSLATPTYLDWRIEQQNSQVLPLATGAATGTQTYTLRGPDATPADANLPPGLSFEAATRTLSGAPTTQAASVLTYGVTNSTSAAAQATATLAVRRQLPAVDNQTYAVQGAAPGLITPLTLGAANGAGTPAYTLTGENNTPLATAIPGLAFDATARVLSGRPQRMTGDVVLVYGAFDAGVDAAAASVASNFTVTITGPAFLTEPPEDNPPLPTDTDLTYNTGVPIAALTLPAIGGENNGYTLLVDGGGALPGGLNFNPTSRVLSGTPTDSISGIRTYAWVYTATDPFGNAITHGFDVVITGLTFDGAVTDISHQVGAAVEATLSVAMDGGNDSAIISYALYGTAADGVVDTANGANLPPGLSFDNAAAVRTLTGTAQRVGAATLTYVATSTAGATATANFVFTVTGGPAFGGDDVPIADEAYPIGLAIAAKALPTASGFGALTYTLRGQDADESSDDLPPGLIFNPTSRALGGRPSVLAAAVTLTYAAADRYGNAAEAMFEVAITSPVFEAAPGDQTFASGTAIAPLILPLARGAGVSYALVGVGGTAATPNLPPGLVFAAHSRTLSGTPSNPAAAVPLAYIATDSFGNPTTLMFMVTVAGPVFTAPTPGPQQYTAGRPISALGLSAANSTVPGDLTYTLTGQNPAAANNGLPLGLSFNPIASGAMARTLSGTPSYVADNTTTSLVYTATDADGGLARQTFAVTVIPGLAFPPPALAAEFTYPAGATSTQTLPEASGGIAPRFHALFGLGGSPNAPALPAWLDFDPATRILTATPSVIAQIPLIYRATDSESPSANFTEVEFTAIVTGPIFAAAALPLADQTYSVGDAIARLTLPMAMSSTDSVVYSLTGTNGQPLSTAVPGLSFNAAVEARILSGTPSAAAAAIDLTYHATDNHGNASEPAIFSLTIDQVLVDDDGEVVSPARFREIFAAVFPLGDRVDITLPAVRADPNGNYVYALVGAGPDDATLTVEVEELVSGLSFDPATRVLSGTPEASVTTTLTYTARPPATPSTTDGGVTVAYAFPFVADLLFADDALFSYQFLVDEEVDATLPEVSGGIGAVVYALLGPAPDNVPIDNAENNVLPGLSFDETSRILSGTPSEPGAVTLTYRVTDSAPAPNVIEEDIVVTVTSGSAALAAVNEVLLPQVAIAMTASATAAITTRIERANGSGNGFALGGQTSLAAALAAHGQPKAADQRDSKTMLAGTSFSLALNGGHGGYGVAGTTAGYAAGGSGGTVLWGSGEYREMSGDSGGVDWGGELYGFHLGVDTRVRHDLLLGVAVSKLQSDIDYRAAAAGAHGMDMTSVNPYLGWQVGGVDLWATIGYGQGDLEITPSGGAAVESDVALRALGLGGSGEIWQQSATTLRLRGEISRSELEVEGNAALAMQTATTRARFGLEASGRRALGGGAIEPSVEFGLRYNGGDGETGTAAQVGAGLRFSGGRYSAHGRIHAVIMPGEYSEWGASGSIAMAAGADGQGFSLELSPSYGPAQSDMAQLWQRDLPPAATAASADYRASMEARLAYGLALKTTAAMLTPYGEMRLGSTTAHRLGINWRSASHAGSHATLNLVGERRQTPAAAHTILLKGELQF